MTDRKKSPIPAKDQESPEPERMVTPEEEAGMDLAELEDPPQAEGTRDAAEEKE
ncbi:MAG TPA: hypothetical protein VFI91_11800 [Longimicrobiaceae bacterium]|nr:hypothetical protein [Longimicrobiaceae bacterium]